MKNEWILGREGDIKIDHPSVGRQHARLTRRGEELILEDLDSTNGTYVDGAPVKVKKITPNNRILLGSCEVDLKRIGLPLSDGEYASAFRRLNGVYETYKKQKLELETKSAWQTAIKRALPMFIFGGLMLLVSLFSEKLRGFLQFFSVFVMAAGGIFAAKDQGKKSEKLLELNENFKMDYVCPDCKVWFGDVPWKSLCNQGKCPRCRRVIEAG